MTLLGDVLRNLGATVDLVEGSLTHGEVEAEEKEDAREGEDEDAGEDGDTSSSKVVRSIRQLGLKRFPDFFRYPISFDFSLYVGAAFAAFISPRLPALDKENTQVPSAFLELFLHLERRKHICGISRGV